VQKDRPKLVWSSKDFTVQAASCVLTEDPARSYGVKGVPEGPSDNMLIHADNLLALKALEPAFAGKIKCIYVDPPFNHGRVDYMADGPDRAAWLTMIKDRFEILRSLLRPDGLLWVNLDRGEMHYCKILLDDVFRGERNFVGQVTYQRSGAAGVGQRGLLVNTAEYLLIYRRGRKAIRDGESLSYSVPLDRQMMRRYNRVLMSPGTRRLVRQLVSVSNNLPVKIYEHEGFEVRTLPPRDFSHHLAKAEEDYAKHFERVFRAANPQKENRLQRDIVEGMRPNVLYSVDYVPSRGRNKGHSVTRFYYGQCLCVWLKDTAALRDGRVVKSLRYTDVWTDINAGNLAAEGGVRFSRGKKPEYLLKRIIELSSRPGDWLLDPFAGSGTAGAVSHKMRRHWIMIENGPQCHTHIAKRLRAVIDGLDKTGVTKAASWEGGGSFRCYFLTSVAGGEKRP
jgi:adenine-specific DNA-methyltransferase